MQNYKSWKDINERLNESVLGGPVTLGLSTPATVGGIVSKFDTVSDLSDEDVLEEMKKKMKYMKKKMNGDEEVDAETGDGEVVDKDKAPLKDKNGDLDDDVDVDVDDDADDNDDDDNGDDDNGDDDNDDDDNGDDDNGDGKGKGKGNGDDDNALFMKKKMKKKMSKKMSKKMKKETTETELDELIREMEEALVILEKMMKKKKMHGDHDHDHDHDDDDDDNGDDVDMDMDKGKGKCLPSDDSDDEKLMLMKKKQKKNMKKEETEADTEWWDSFKNMTARCDTKNWDGMTLEEDALLAPENPNDNLADDKNPGPGEVGFAPSQRMGTASMPGTDVEG